jgi:hypothetical protein
MVGEARQLGGGGIAVIPFGERDAQYCRRIDRILSEGLVKISYPEQQDRVRVFLLDGAVLLHQRRFAAAF